MTAVIEWKQAIFWTVLILGDKEVSFELPAARRTLTHEKTQPPGRSYTSLSNVPLPVWVALFIIDKDQKQPKRPSTGEETNCGLCI